MITTAVVNINSYELRRWHGYARFVSKTVVIAIAIVGGTALATLAVVVAAVLATRQTQPSSMGIDPTTVTQAAPRPPPGVPPKPKTRGERLDEMTFGAALADIRPDMADSRDEPSVGALVLTAWSVNHLRWADVAVTTDETTNALAKKDPDAARGKRLCTSGSIIEINVERDPALGKFFIGLLENGGGALYRFHAVHDTGNIVQSSWARFCGVVTGLFDYANSGGGTGHAVSIVGMFDLPSNTAWAPVVQAKRAL